MTEVSSEELQALLEKVSPPEWKAHDAYGLVFLANTDEEQHAVFQTLRRWGARDGFPLRLPHYTVSSAGLSKAGQPHGSELDVAIGGILVLDEFAEFDDHALYNLEKRITRERLPVVVIGIDTLEAHFNEDPDAYMKRLKDKAATLGLPVVTMDDFDEVLGKPGVDVSDALNAINRHRVLMGMRRLDQVAAGWTDQDVLLEAERIARLSNPLLDLKRRLLQTRAPNQGYAAEEYPIFPVTKWNQTYVFPLTEKDDALLRRVAREEDWRMRRMEGMGPYRFARMGYHVSAPDPIDDPPFSLVELHGWRGWWAEPAPADPEGVVFWNFIEPDQTDKELEMDLGRLFVGPYANPENDQVGLFGKKQAEIEGFGLVSSKGKPFARARPGKGTQSELVSRKVSPKKMVELRERELAERAAKKGKKRRKNRAEDEVFATIRDAIAGMRAVVISNRKDRNLESGLEREFGLDSVVVDAAGRPRRIRSIADSIASRCCDLVIAVTGFLPHKDDIVLARAARKADVAYIRARKNSLSSIARALERDLGLGRAANPERWLAPKLSPAQRARLKQLHDVYFDLFDEVESLPDATLTTETGEYTVPEGYALVYRVGGVDYMFFQDEAPDETWTFVTVGRGGENDRVEHLRDYLAVLERVNALVTEQVRRRPNPTTSALASDVAGAVTGEQLAGIPGAIVGGLAGHELEHAVHTRLLKRRVMP